MITDTDNLREKRLSFYTAVLEPITELLRECVRLSDCSCALLIDKDGYMVTKSGSEHDIDLQSVAALAASSYAATHAMAKLLGEDGFSVLCNQGQTESVLLTLVSDRAFLATVFDDRTTLGMVDLYTKEVGEKLEKTLAAAAASA